jgi:putative flippase GtrA
LATFGILLATACGFIIGLVFNYVFSFIFVFKQIDEKAQKHKIRSFVIFTVIGVIGLWLTELFMYAGIKLFGQTVYLIIKIVTAIVVLLWNYIARKMFIFKGVQYGTK